MYGAMWNSFSGLSIMLQELGKVELSCSMSLWKNPLAVLEFGWQVEKEVLENVVKNLSQHRVKYCKSVTTTTKVTNNCTVIKDCIQILYIFAYLIPTTAAFRSQHESFVYSSSQ